MLPGNSRSILVASVEHQEWVRLPKEIFLVQLVGTELHRGDVLMGGESGGVRLEEAGRCPSPHGSAASGPREQEDSRHQPVRKGSISRVPCTDQGPGPGLTLPRVSLHLQTTPPAGLTEPSVVKQVDSGVSCPRLNPGSATC